MNTKLNVYTLSSLAKVFLNGIYGEPFSGASLLKNEEYSYQIGYIWDVPHGKVDLTLRVDSPLAEYISIRKVGNVPSELPAYEDADDNYLQKTPGLFPDPLVPYTNGVQAGGGVELEGICGTFHSLWVTLKPEGSFEPGSYPIRVTLSNPDEGIEEVSEVTLEILDDMLPEQDLIVTQWFHTDCIAAYYGLETFSPAHWEWIEKFMRTAVDNGQNMVLTPVFTPPLDTRIGGERPTTQLVDVKVKEDGWEFGFDKLNQWIETAHRAGVKYFEISHLFTQWGAQHAPKIVDVEGNRLYGWDTDAVGPEYVAFLNAFLPALTSFLREQGIADKAWFHLSDEPHLEVLENYSKAYAVLKAHLTGFRTFDALSNIEFFKEGLVQTPVAAINRIEPFLEENVSPLWAYYCCGQGVDVSNRFFAMPSSRNRIIGVQMYKYNIEGFLQWGYNFYFSHLSKEQIDPWHVTDGINMFQSGDAFIVYPGKHEVVESLRLKVFHEAMQDMRAFHLLESRIGKEKVMQILEDGIEPITFASYPREEEYLLALREKVNHALLRTRP